MANHLEQNDIDELLNSNLDLGTDEPENESEPVEKPFHNKVFKSRRIKQLRFEYPYRSPVIKKENILYNPNNGNRSSNGKVVVRDLKNYAQFIREKYNKW